VFEVTYSYISLSLLVSPLLSLNVCPECANQAVQVALAVRQGRLDLRINCNHAASSDPTMNTLKNAFNSMADQLQRFTTNVLYVAHETAVKGKLGVQADCDDEIDGVWRDLILNLNSMTRNHLEQVRDIADVSTAIARGDLSKTMTVPVKGETLLLKNTFNTMGNAFFLKKKKKKKKKSPPLYYIIYIN
jgi:HAMP domain-containing protein